MKAQVALEYITAFLIIAFVLVILTYLIISYDYAHRTILNFISKEISCQNYASILSSLYLSSKHIKFDFNSDENFFILKYNTIMLGDLNFTPSLLADENFESGTTSGGNGWLTDWQLNGDATITTAGTPHSGSYHLRLRRSTGYAERSLSLKNATYAKLYFWRKLKWIELLDKAFVKISCNKTNWKTIAIYTGRDADNIYHLEEYDLNAYLGCENFYIAFDAEMSTQWDYFYIDDINIMFQKPQLKENSTQCKFFSLLNKSDEILSTQTTHFESSPFEVSSYSIIKGTLAFEDFETSKPSDANGFSTNWNLSGDASITMFGTPHSGSYHLRLRRSTGYAERSLSLKNATYAKLYFWRKLNSFEGTDKAFVKISCNKTNWETIFSYADGDDDNIYHLEEYDLNAYLGCENFYIAFDAEMNTLLDYFYIDDLNIFAEVKK